MSGHQKKIAIFLDRDGTIIVQKNKLNDVREVRLLPHVGEAIRQLKDLGFFLVVITNQPDMARGIVTERDTEAIHEAIQKKLKRYGVQLDAFYVCPHEHKDGCKCRKPEIGMITDAVRDHHLSLKGSIVIGDNLRDIETGRRAKLPTILVRTGDGGRDKRFFDLKADYEAKDLLASVRIVKKISASFK
jgi:histidinol-phosphate phosphatase family protein